MARGLGCGVREAPRHEIAEGEPVGFSGRYGDLTSGPIGVDGVGRNVRSVCLSAAGVASPMLQQFERRSLLWRYLSGCICVGGVERNGCRSLSGGDDEHSKVVSAWTGS